MKTKSFFTISTISVFIVFQSCCPCTRVGKGYKKKDHTFSKETVVIYIVEDFRKLYLESLENHKNDINNNNFYQSLKVKISLKKHKRNGVLKFDLSKEELFYLFQITPVYHAAKCLLIKTAIENNILKTMDDNQKIYCRDCEDIIEKMKKAYLKKWYNSLVFLGSFLLFKYLVIHLYSRGRGENFFPPQDCIFTVLYLR